MLSWHRFNSDRDDVRLLTYDSVVKLRLKAIKRLIICLGVEL